MRLTDRPSPRTDALRRHPLNSNDLRAWQSLADRLEQENQAMREALIKIRCGNMGAEKIAAKVLAEIGQP